MRRSGCQHHGDHQMVHKHHRRMGSRRQYWWCRCGARRAKETQVYEEVQENISTPEPKERFDPGAEKGHPGPSVCLPEVAKREINLWRNLSKTWFLYAC